MDIFLWIFVNLGVSLTCIQKKNNLRDQCLAVWLAVLKKNKKLCAIFLGTVSADVTFSNFAWW